MQTRQLKSESCQTLPVPDPQTWRVIRADTRTRRAQRARCRRWRRIRALAGRSMLLLGSLFVLTWITISILSPRDHLIAGIILLLILGAQAASVIAYTVSDAMLAYLCGGR